MARVGLSYPRYARYNNNNGTVTYTNGGSLGKAISLDLTVDGANDNILYADNAPAESASSFAGGSVKIGTDDLYDDAAVDILGWERNELTEPEGAVEIVRKAGAIAPYTGVGGIIKHIRGGATAWTALILTKTQFKDPGISVTTQGDTIEWQTSELEGNVMRDDSTDGVWCRHATFTTEAFAKAYIDGILVPKTAQSQATQQ